MIRALEILATAATLSSVASGWWQVRTMVQGDHAATTILVCLTRSGDRSRAILPSAITNGCDASGACRSGGSLSIEGSYMPDRFDVIARRIGPVAQYRRAVALLHVEGRRLAAACPVARR